jgi:hypothetical protein
MDVLWFGPLSVACSTTYFLFVAVPHSPRNLTIEKVTSNSVLVHWEPPLDSIYSEYSIR